VAEAAARIEANAIAKPVAVESGRTTKAAARVAVRQAMLEVAHTARGLKQQPEGGPRLLQMPKTKAEQEVVQAARRFVTLGESVKDELVSLGLSPTALERLAEATKRYADEIEERRHTRGKASELQRNLNEAMTMGLEAARELDIVVPNLLRGEPGLMANWRTNRRVLLGKRKSAADSPPEAVAVAAPTAPATPAAAVEGDPLLKAS
jgi:hypothetical protein